MAKRQSRTEGGIVHNCIKGQWYERNGEYYQCESNGIIWGGKNICWFRKAGYPEAIFAFDEYDMDKLKPVSLEPDFSHIKEGDPCFSAEFGSGIMSESPNDYALIHDFIIYDIKDRQYHHESKYILPDNNTISHPSLFNSFDQFMAYWAEQKLIRSKS